MGRGRSKKTLTRRYRDGELRRGPDELIVEEPLSIQLDGVLVGTTMRTPGHDFELAVGFLHGDGFLGGAEVLGIRYCGDGSAVESEFNTVTVDTGAMAPTPTPRLGPSSSSCGLCGAEAIEDLRARVHPLTGLTPVSVDVLAAVPSAVRDRQDLFDATGAVHAAATFTSDGGVLDVREDIGRHNAVDKVVGRQLLDQRLPAGDLGLYVSGRASFEMVQKAWAAGFSALVAVSAPSALAVEAANAAGLTLAGFARDGDLNLYTG